MTFFPTMTGSAVVGTHAASGLMWGKCSCVPAPACLSDSRTKRLCSQQSLLPLLLLCSKMSEVTWLCGCMADGEPTGEPKGAVVQTIRQVKQFCAGSQYGEGAITFEFAQVQHICPAASHLHAWYCFHGCPWQALMPTAACLKVCQLRQSYSCAVASPSPCSLSELCALCLPHCCPCTCCCVFLLMLCPKPCVVPDLVRYSQGHVIKQ